MSAPELKSTDITAFFPVNAGALEKRNLNLGGDIGDDEIVSSLLYNFAPDVSRDQIKYPGYQPRGLWSLYYCFYLINNNPSVTVINVKIWIYRAMSDPNLAVAIGLDPGGKNAVAKTIPDQFTAPAGVIFKTPFTENSTTVLQIPIFDAGDRQAIWVRQYGNTGIASIAQASYGIKWKFERPLPPPP